MHRSLESPHLPIVTLKCFEPVIIVRRSLATFFTLDAGVRPGDSEELAAARHVHEHIPLVAALHPPALLQEEGSGGRVPWQGKENPLVQLCTFLGTGGCIERGTSHVG